MALTSRPYTLETAGSFPQTLADVRYHGWYDIYMKEVLLKILEDIDPDIKAHLFEKSGKYYNWELVNDPVLTALLWQIVRDNKNAHEAR